MNGETERRRMWNVKKSRTLCIRNNSDGDDACDVSD